MSRIVKTRAIVLRYYPVSNTSRIVSWLTENFGRVSTMIKGSLRDKSLFLGQYDLFYTCELLFYHHDARELHPAREITPLSLRQQLRRDWRACAAASYLSDLFSRTIPDNTGASHRLFSLLDSGLDNLARRGAGPELLFYQELQLLNELGLQPQLDRCCITNERLTPTINGQYLSLQRGGVISASKREGESGPCIPISPPALQMLRKWQKASGPESALNTLASPGQARELELLLGKFMEYHLEIQPASRPLAFSLIRETPAA